jgi:hypothetical protein
MRFDVANEYGFAGFSHVASAVLDSIGSVVARTLDLEPEFKVKR